jgi:hypothetical protein
MKFWNWIKGNKIIIGTIWGVATTCISLWLTFSPIDQNPKLTFYEQYKWDAFSLNEPYDELQILLKGRDLRKDSLNIKIFRVKLINEGKRDIKNIDYFSESLFGLQVNKGDKILKVSFGKTADVLIKKNILKGISDDSSKVVFNKVGIQRGKFIVFDVWVVHGKNSAPVLIPQGRIADTEIVYTTNKEDGEPAYIDFFYIILIIFGILFGLWLVVASIEAVVRFFTRVIRAFFIRKYLDHHFDYGNKMHRILEKLYSYSGKKEFLFICNTLMNIHKANAFYQEDLTNKLAVERINLLAESKKISLANSNLKYESNFLLAVDLFVEANMIGVDVENKLAIKQELFDGIDIVLKQLAKNGVE